MRLVDADELPWVDKLIVLNKCDGDIIVMETKEYASYVDEDTPTVEAIPVEFIKQLIEKFDCEKGNAIKDTYAHILSALLEFWEFGQEEENEIDDLLPNCVKHARVMKEIENQLEDRNGK